MKSALRLLLLFSFLYCPALSAEDNTIKIGIILPLSGSLASVGTSFRDAAKMGLADSGSDLHHKYQLIFEDDKLEPKLAASAAIKLINVDKVDAIISTWSYGGSIVAPMAERAKIIHFASAWDARFATGKYTYLHLSPPEEFVSKLIAGFKYKNYSKVAAIAIQESGSAFALTELEKQLKENKLELVSTQEITDWSETNLRPYLLNAKQKNPDVIYANIVSPMIELMLKQAGELKIDIPIVAMTGYDTSNDLGLLEGKWYVTDSYFESELETRFVKQYKHDRLYGASNYYDMIRLLVYIFDKASLPEDREKLPELLEANLADFPSIFGRLELVAPGVFKYPSRYIIVKNGKRLFSSLTELDF
ncbi:MAG: ABC transporter substrate-binding protein [Bdellovibrionota bacterium]